MHFGILQPLMCRAGLHVFDRPRRVRGFRVRRCAACHLRQVEQFPGPTWRTVAVKRVRRKAEPDEHSGSRTVLPILLHQDYPSTLDDE